MRAGIFEKSYNLFDLSGAQTQTINGIDFIIDSQTGTVTLNGTALQSRDTTIVLPINNDLSGDYYVSGCPDGGSYQTFDIYVLDNTTRERVKQWDGTTAMESVLAANQSKQIQLVQGHNSDLRIRARYGVQFDNLVFLPMIRVPSAPATFEPYGNVWHNISPKMNISNSWVDKPDLPEKFVNGNWQ